MTAFPENYGVLLVWVAVFETIAGTRKRKLQSIWAFWNGLCIQVGCAMSLAIAIVLQLLRAEYSGAEKTAAILSLMFVTVVTIMEAVGVYKERTLFINDNRNETMHAAAVISVGLLFTALPILVGITQRASWRAFNSPALSIILLLITILPAVSAFLFIPMFEHSFVGLVPQNSETLFHESVIFPISLMFYCSVLGLPLLVPLTLVLGIVILVRGDNLSLSLLVLGNIFPCLALGLSSSFVINSSESQGDQEYDDIQ